MNIPLPVPVLLGGTGVTTSTGSGANALATSPTLVTPTLGVATATSINGNAISTGTGTLQLNSHTFTVTTNSGTLAFSATTKTLTVANSITLAGTDSTTMTFPSTSATIARTDAANTFTGVQTFSSLPTIPQTPSAATDAASKGYVDAAVLGQDFKQACNLATTTSLTTYTYNNGSSGVGATITLVATGVIAFDGTNLTAGMRVLVKNETSTNTPNNGIYTVTIAGALGVALVLTRATDFNQSSEIDTGDSTFITAGTTQGTTTWAYNGATAPTIGTTNITFAQTAGQGSFTGGAGITITGTSIAITAPVTVALGGTNATSASITAFNNITGYTAAGATGTTSTNLVFSTSPTITSLTTNTELDLVGSSGTLHFTAATDGGDYNIFSSNGTQTLAIYGSSSNVLNLNLLDGALSMAGNTTISNAGVLTHVTLDSAGTGNSLKVNGTALTAVTGTGSVVLATSPTLVTPLLGTPTSGVMTNVTGTASGLTSGITDALASATTTVNVSSATAPSSGQVLTATGSTAATWQTAGTSPWTGPMLIKSLETGDTSTYNVTTSNSGSVTGDYRRIILTTGTTPTSLSEINWDWTPTTAYQMWLGTMSMAWGGIINTPGTDFDIFIGIGSMSPSGSGMGSTTLRHFGFRRTRVSSGSVVLTCTQSDGVTQNTAVVTDPGITISCFFSAIATGTSVLYYVNGALLATLSSNTPINSGAFQQLPMQIAVANSGVATSTVMYTFGYSFTQQYPS